jgi:hypothetical protein
MVNVASTDDWLDPGRRAAAAGEVHGWGRGQNSTVCGLSLHRSRLRTFGEVWPESPVGCMATVQASARAARPDRAGEQAQVVDA